MLVHSGEICRVDLIRWGVELKLNNQCYYFEDSERQDVTKHCDEFVSQILTREDGKDRVSSGD